MFPSHAGAIKAGYNEQMKFYWARESDQCNLKAIEGYDGEHFKGL